jgi:hypothetical protein
MNNNFQAVILKIKKTIQVEKRNKKFINPEKWKKLVPVYFFAFILVMPASTNYKLKDYGFGSGGTGGSTSPNYAIEAITGELSGSQGTSPSYKIGPGMIYLGQANVPGAPTFDNPSNYYNKLRLIINTSDNPTDTKYAIAISTDDFADTNYVQNDNTIGETLGAEDYQNYTGWGGAVGIYVIGLDPGTTYKVKVKAIQGRFSETGYGPMETAATINPTLSFGVRTTSQTNPPFSVDFGGLLPNSINTSPENILISIDTNGASGGMVYVSGSNAGLNSVHASHKIDAVSGNLTGLPEGFGAQGVSANQTSGGPFAIADLYDQGSDIVGIIDQTVREIFNTPGPIVGGSGSFLLKAKPSATAPAASDYTETLTIIAAGVF